MKSGISSGWTTEIPYDRFQEFIATDAERYQILLERIETLRLNSAVFQVKGNSHIFIFPRAQQSIRSSKGVFPFRGQSPIMLSAHYDRVEGSPGANDNSAAVFHLLKTASILDQWNLDNWMVVFTDKEELKEGEGVAEQGSFSLAEKLRDWGLENARIFIFDACGVGDTFIISSTSDHIMKNRESPGAIKARQLIRQLRDHALNTARNLNLSKILLAPTPFSDDAGFLRAGFPAQTITMLPSKESGAYGALLRSRPEFADILITGTANNPTEHRLIPETWRTLNGPNDKFIRLTPQFYGQVIRFAVELCR